MVVFCSLTFLAYFCKYFVFFLCIFFVFPHFLLTFWSFCQNFFVLFVMDVANMVNFFAANFFVFFVFVLEDYNIWAGWKLTGQNTFHIMHQFVIFKCYSCG